LTTLSYAPRTPGKFIKLFTQAGYVKNEYGIVVGMDFSVVGLTGGRPFSATVDHFRSLGGDAVLFDPDMVCGPAHLLSAAEHAARAFSNGTNRSKTLATEMILYAAGERQISKAMKKMNPKDPDKPVAAVVISLSDLRLEAIGAERCDDILEANVSKARALGIDRYGKGIDPESLALELVAMLEIEKK
jgi:KEOPS complex subunit Cgi121